MIGVVLEYRDVVSTGQFKDFQPAALARQYVAGGASALSVLTDRKYFQGDLEFLVQAREAVDIPVLRKDFIFSEYQVFESALLGADCILLIAAALEDRLLDGLYQVAGGLRLDVLVEVHDEAEAGRAARLGARIVGVNNRDLGTFQVSLSTSERLAPLLAGAAVRVSESGITSRADLHRLAACGYRAVLVGEHLMRHPDITAATRELLGAMS
ncbi:indole-3-glycerol phosphate synthase TrpC [bacterium]|nr:indole-3-glycerol phosphate synthase TrpC [bacterium]